MERTIKFRGLCRKTNQWVYGMLMYSVSDSGLVIVETVNAQPSMDAPLGDTLNLYHGIVQGTESQFTGLHDKQGKEIYEGDVIECTLSHNGSTLPHLGEVVYSNDFCSFATKNDGGITLFCKHNINTRKVIGNVFENPELLTNHKGLKERIRYEAKVKYF